MIIVKIQLSKISIKKFKNDFHLSINSLIINQLQTTYHQINIYAKSCVLVQKQTAIILIPSNTFSPICDKK